MWAYSPQNAEIGNFWYKFAQKGYTPYATFTKCGLGADLPGLHPHAKFYHCGFKDVGLQPPKLQKIGNFWYIFASKEYIPYSNFYKLWHGEGLHVPTITLTFNCVALKMWPYGRQNRQAEQSS